jgi:hypothetical protein
MFIIKEFAPKGTSYDVREPDWAASLKDGVAYYWRKAIKYPVKSIPQPFRSFLQSEKGKVSFF